MARGSLRLLLAAQFILNRTDARCLLGNNHFAESHSSQNNGPFLDRLLHNNKDNKEPGGTKGAEGNPGSNPRQPAKKEGEKSKIENRMREDEHKFKDYIKADEAREQEGGTYGGLM